MIFVKLLITSDWHLRGTVPSCVDATPTEWMDIQRQALEKVKSIALREGVSAILCGGDIFHSDASTTFECVTMVQRFAKDLREESSKERGYPGILFYILSGNHDLPYHSSENLDKAAVGILYNSDNVGDMETDCFVKGCNFDRDDYEGREAIFKHVLTIPKEQVPFGVECETPESLLEKYPAKWVFTGDYHHNFHYEKDGRHVINAGCLTKQAADFENYHTGVYIVDIDSETVAFQLVDIPQKFVKNGGKSKAADKSVEDFANSIKRESVTLDFISELREKSRTQKEAVKEKVGGWIEKIGQ